MDDARYREWFPKVEDLIWNDLSQYIEHIEREGHIPHKEVIPKLAALGLYGSLVPESYGGLGLTVKQYVPVLIELSKMYAGLRGYLHTHVSATKLLEFATDEQKARIYPGIASGKIQLAFALTEPDNGTGTTLCWFVIPTAARALKGSACFCYRRTLRGLPGSPSGA